MVSWILNEIRIRALVIKSKFQIWRFFHVYGHTVDDMEYNIRRIRGVRVVELDAKHVVYKLPGGGTATFSTTIKTIKRECE